MRTLIHRELISGGHVSALLAGGTHLTRLGGEKVAEVITPLLDAASLGRRPRLPLPQPLHLRRP